MRASRDKAIQWAVYDLESRNYILDDKDPEKILETPWSYVARFNTSNGYIYLKQTPQAIAIEPHVIKTLANKFDGPVPTVIAFNDDLQCFLMKDAGTSLRSILKENFDVDLMCKAITQFADFQVLVSENVDTLLEIGVPDWRLDRIPSLYAKMISDKELFVADGLSLEEHNKLLQLQSRVEDLCKALSKYPVNQTIVQPDFNDNNTLVSKNTNQMTIIDLGELSISHPFFSLFNCMQQMTKHYGFTEKDGVYQKLKKTCFNGYMERFATISDFEEAYNIAYVLWDVYGILAYHRLVLACNQEALMKNYKGRLAACARTLFLNLS